MYTLTKREAVDVATALEVTTIGERWCWPPADGAGGRACSR